MTLGTGTESALIIDIAFWVIAVSSIVAAFAVVKLRDLFRAALLRQQHMQLVRGVATRKIIMGTHYGALLRNTAFAL